MKDYPSSPSSALSHGAGCLLLAALVTAGLLPRAHAQPQGSFRDLLAVSDIPPESLTAVPAGLPLDGGSRQLVEKVLFRLSRLEPEFLARTASPAELPALARGDAALRGQVLTFHGRIVEAARLPAADPGGQTTPPIRCVMELESADLTAVVWANHVPPAWLNQDRLHERASVRGAFAGARQEGSARPRLVVLADRLAWHPDARGAVEVPLGHRLLGDYGVDVGRLGDIRHALPLSRRDRRPFYELLAVSEELGAGEMIRAARRSLADYAEPWRQEMRSATGQRALLAKAVTSAAAEGRFSVAPLFLDAEHQVGHLVVLDGIARRAIRIKVADSPTAFHMGVPGDVALDHYFELEVFTPDSQNLPVVCCVPSLPAGFPVGDKIRQPVRVAGFFFKLWRYDSRSPREDVGGPLRFEPAAAPLLIGAEPQWRATQDRPSNALGWITGGAFAAGLALICWVVWAWSRSDRRLRSRRSFRA